MYKLFQIYYNNYIIIFDKNWGKTKMPQTNALKNENNVTELKVVNETKIDAKVISGAELDIKKVPRLVGAGPIAKAKEILELMRDTSIPLICVGDSGTGKSAVMKAVLKVLAAERTAARWAIPHGKEDHLCSAKYHCHSELEAEEKDQYVKAYYFQISRDETKTTIFLGNRMIAGTYQTVKGVLAIAAEQKAVVAVDELGHSTHAIVTMFNAFDGDSSIIANGDIAIDASDMRIIFGTNSSSHAGNIKLPQSFVNRVLEIPFEYPDFNDEVAIAMNVAHRLYKKGTSQITVPIAVAKYITSFMREFRTSTFPLSARNISRGIVLCQMAPVINKNVYIPAGKYDRYFKNKSNAEPLIRMISKRILEREITSADDLLKDDQLVKFIEFVSQIGVEKFKSILLQSVNFHIDSEGIEMHDDIKQKISNSLI